MFGPLAYTKTFAMASAAFLSVTLVPALMVNVRMARMLRRARGGPACVIGADIPGVTRPRIAEAFDALGSHDAVFGPAPDGGYWLIGLKHPAVQPPEFLHAVRWSTDHALADSIATLKDHRIARVATLRDVDSAADLK